MWSDGQKGEEAGSQVIFLLPFLLKEKTILEINNWLHGSYQRKQLDFWIMVCISKLRCAAQNVRCWDECIWKIYLEEVSQSQEWCTIPILLLTNIIQKHDQCYFCSMSKPEYQLKVIHIIQSSLKQLMQLFSPQPSLKKLASTGWKLFSMVRSSDGFLRSGEPMPP